MKRNYFFISILIFISIAGCSDDRKIDTEQHQREKKQSELAYSIYKSALKHAEENNSAGFVKLYEIATDDLTYTVEISELANERLHQLLYSKTDLWIKSFSKLDLQKVKAYIKWSGIEVSELPEGITSDEQFKEIIFNKLEKIKGNKKERELINYIFELYKKKNGTILIK